jgi:peptidoglycan/LPS O-acetylase OafA/YrhL
MTQASTLQYRAELDGLRALAVLMVLLYHLGVAAIPGGFVGVDVFFVISGYLIGRIILGEMAQGQFSLVSFYERRVRRIMPALLLVGMVCVPAAWLILFPPEYRDFSASLVALQLFATNIEFWRESGYFAPAAEFKPLLHTWSLAVEEQFYLFFPLAIWGLYRVARRHLAVLLTLAMLLSFALAVWCSKVSPSFSFYMLPMRAWELLAGVMICGYVWPDKWTGCALSWRNLGALTGLCMLFAAALVMTRSTQHPGLWTLLPVIGAVLVIAFAKPDTWVGRFLSVKWMVGLGLVSYGLYLWHYPFVALGKYYLLEPFSPWQMGAIAAVSLLLAYLSWRWVERPFRNPQQCGRRIVFMSVGVCMAGLTLAGIMGVVFNGFPSRIDGQKQAFLDFFDNSHPHRRYVVREGLRQSYKDECNFYQQAQHEAGFSTVKPKSSIPQGCTTRNASSRHTLFLWGDSHAAHYRPGLDAELDASWQVFQVSTSNCRPTWALSDDPLSYCQHSAWVALENIRRLRPDVVMLAQSPSLPNNELSGLALALREIGVTHVIVVGPVPFWHASLPLVIARRDWERQDARSASALDISVFELDARLRNELQDKPGIRYVSPVQHLCNQYGCLTYLGADRQSTMLSWDQGHLTTYASRQLVRELLLDALPPVKP